MGYVIESLRLDHRKTIGELLRAKELRLKSPDGYKVLSDAWKELLRHLRREDDVLYVRLREAAGDDPELSELLDRFQVETASVTRDAIGFFKKMERDSEAVDIAREFGILINILRNRIMREEDILFPEFERRFGA